MNRYCLFATALMFAGSACQTKQEEKQDANPPVEKVQLITLDPGHFHASLVQKVSYPQVDKDVHVYAPAGFDVDAHLARIDGFNSREQDPTSWNEIVYTGEDYLEKMISEKKGNVMVQAGNNGKKTQYIKRTLEAGINVLSDKPMAINSENFHLLEECFETAKQNHVLLYDIMTERSEITTILQRELSMIPDVYGVQVNGTKKDPAIVKESVHHLFKLVDGKPLTRPVWYFDVNQQGEGIVDVTTHLVDLVQWEAFPDQVIDYKQDIELLDANRWPTPISRKEFEQVTATKAYPDFLQDAVQNDTLQLYCNGDILYKLKGVVAKVSVIWNYTFPKGGGDTHYSVMHGSKAALIIRQGEEQGYRPELYIEAEKRIELKPYESLLAKAMEQLAERYPGIALKKLEEGKWQVEIPDSYRVGHEAHFGQVTERYLEYLKAGKLPEWEVPNMLSKYYTTTAALDLAKSK